MDILLVDDDKSLLDQLQEFLESEDRKSDVKTSSSAEEALERLQDEQFDIVVSEYSLPKKDGLGLLEDIREKRENDIPFIFFTREDREEVAVEPLNLGADAYLKKGETSTSEYERLVETIEESVQHRETRYELKKNSKVLSAILHDLPMLVLVVDRDRRVKKINDTGLKFADKSREEILDRKGGEALRCLNRLEHPKGCGFSEQCENCTIRNCVLDTFESGDTNFRKKGSLPSDAVKEDFFFRVTTSPLKTSDHERVIVCVEDITRLESIKRQLKRSSRRFESIFNDPETFIYILDTDGKILSANEAVLESIDEAGSEIAGDKFWEMPCWSNSKEGQNLVRNNVSEAIDGSYVHFETTKRRANGDEMSVDFSIRPVEDEDGNVTSLVAQGKDITARKETERELGTIQKAMESSIAGIAIASREGELQYVNDSFIEMWGYSEEEILGKSLEEFWESEEKARQINHEVAERGTWRGELTAEKKDGTTFPVEVAANVIRDDKGKSKALMASFLDKTDKKRSEERREFLHSVLRHDVKNKIQLSKGYLKLLEEKDENLDQYIEKLYKSIESAEDIIEKIKTLERVGEGEEIQRLKLSRIIDQIVSNYQEKARDKGVDLEVKEITSKVRGGALLLNLFENLIENSIKHSRCDRIIVESEVKGDQVVVSVKDDGKGLTDELKEKIFERGYKKGKTSGSGLGMYLVKKIAESYGGKVEVKDAAIGGARFDVRLGKS